jgi:hypothetical protein
MLPLELTGLSVEQSMARRQGGGLISDRLGLASGCLWGAQLSAYGCMREGRVIRPDLAEPACMAWPGRLAWRVRRLAGLHGASGWPCLHGPASMAWRLVCVCMQRTHVRLAAGMAGWHGLHGGWLGGWFACACVASCSGRVRQVLIYGAPAQRVRQACFWRPRDEGAPPACSRTGEHLLFPAG